jgi:GNAT superfamily N-acetyltransferase
MAAWRTLSVSDIEGVLRVADEIHPDLPEGGRVFTERARLFPEGCLVLAEEGDGGGAVCGYAISHPVRRGQPPALDSLLGEIAPDADQYYIHDVAVLPRWRGRGLAAECVGRLLAVAGRCCPTTCLVSVYGTAPFWARFGFAADEAAEDAVLAEKLRRYGTGAVYMSRQNAPTIAIFGPTEDR